MFPRQYVFIVGGLDATVPVPVSVSAGGRCGDTINVCGGGSIVTWQCAKSVEKSEIRSFDAILRRYQVTHARAGDQFLALEHAAQQQADDHEHDRDLDQGKSGLLFSHDSNPPITLVGR